VACIVGLGVATGVAVGRTGSSAAKEYPGKRFFHTTGRDGTGYELSVGGFYRRLDGRANVSYAMQGEPPDLTTTNPDGTTEFESRTSGDSIEVALADRRRRVEMLSFQGTDPCRAAAVFGSVVHSAARVVAKREDGSTRRLRRIRAPRAWHYKGWLIGTFIGDDPKTERVSVFDRKGRRIGWIGVPNDNDPACVAVRNGDAGVP
jgi:hypothetical protein